LIDLEALRVEYVTGKTTYGQIAKKYGISKGYLGTVAKREGWVQQRDAFRKSVAEKAIGNLRDQGVKELERLAATANRFNGILERMGNDADQFNRWIGPKGEVVVLEKTDAKEFKAATAALNEMVKVTRNLFGVPDRMEDRADKREERRLTVYENSNGKVDDSNVGVIMMPPVLEEEPEDAPEVNS